MLNRLYDDDKSTLLFLACGNGHESMVTRLLSLGARQQTIKLILSGLTMAAMQDRVGVVRLLLNGGMQAIGDKAKFPNALYTAARWSKPRVFQLLLVVDGEGWHSIWANTLLDGKRLLSLLSFGTAYCYPAVMGVLLVAGADEAARETQGRIPRDVVGMALGRGLHIDRGKEIAVRRMLERGLAYRARSCA